MFNIIDRLRRYRLAKRIYDYIIRQYLPYKIGGFNQVPVRGVIRLLDATDEVPEYEESLIESIRSSVKVGDDVIVIGGGYGVSTVVAGRQVRNNGSVQTYEGSSKRLEVLKETITLNGVEDICTVSHAVVGEAVKLIGNMGDAEAVSPNQLPDCDVLVLDCEGAESGIIKKMSITPDTIIVETHGFLDSPKQVVRRNLKGQNYIVTKESVEDSSRGIFVLTAEKVSD